MKLKNIRTRQMLFFIMLLFFTGVKAANTSPWYWEIDSLERVLKNHPTEDTNRVKILHKIALRASAQDVEKSRYYAEQARLLSERINFTKGKAISLNLYALTHFSSNKKLALSYLEQALFFAEKAGFKKGVDNYLINIGKLKVAMGDVEEGEEYMKKGYKIALEINDEKMIISYLLQSSRLQDRKGNYKKAIEQLQEVVRLANKLGLIEVPAGAYSEMAGIYYRQGNYPISLEYHLYALKVYEEIKNRSNQLDALGSIAVIQSIQNDYKAAFKTLHKAFKIAQDVGDSLQTAKCLRQIGELHAKMKNPVAMKYLKKALSMMKDNNALESVATLTSIGSLYSEQGDYGKALNSLEEALALAQKMKYKRGCCNAWINIGTIYLKQKQYQRAMEYAHKALDLSVDLEQLDIRKESYKLLSDLYAATGNFDKAYQNRVQYQSLSDSIFNEKDVRKMAMFEASYQFAKERQMHEMVKEKQSLEMKSQRQTIVFLVVNLLLILILAFAIYWSNKLKKKVLRLKIEKINHELEMNQKAMAAATLKLVQNSERDANSIKVLESVEKNTIEESKKEIRSLIADYKLKSYNSNWEEFEIMFEKINSSFYEKLNERYPTLTPNERKLCVFLKLNMSNNHISQITFQSEEALKKARLRLRKKLEIERDVNLTAFIQGL